MILNYLPFPNVNIRNKQHYVKKFTVISTWLVPLHDQIFREAPFGRQRIWSRDQPSSCPFGLFHLLFIFWLFLIYVLEVIMSASFTTCCNCLMASHTVIFHMILHGYMSVRIYVIELYIYNVTCERIHRESQRDQHAVMWCYLQ